MGSQRLNENSSRRGEWLTFYSSAERSDSKWTKKFLLDLTIKRLLIIFEKSVIYIVGVEAWHSRLRREWEVSQ